MYAAMIYELPVTHLSVNRLNDLASYWEESRSNGAVMTFSEVSVDMVIVSVSLNTNQSL